MEEKVFKLTEENEYLKCELESLKELKENTEEIDNENESHSLETTVNMNNNSFNLFSNLTCKNLILNNIEVIYRKEDGYINATKLCQAGDKEFKAWNKNDKTKRFLDVFSSLAGIPANEIIKYESGSIQEISTWVHPQVAINIAQWISPEFDVQVSKWVYELQKYNDELICENQNIKKENELLQINNINSSSVNLFKNLTGNNIVLNNIEVIYRKEDGYINATKLCQAGEKQLRAWKQNDKTKRFLDVLSSTVRILTVELLKQEQGGNGERHTWVHPQVAINIAQWISPEFDVQVSKWVYELCITGNVSLDTKKTTQELDNMLKEKYEKQLQEINRLQEIENKYKYELDILKTRENELKEELEQYKHQNIKYTNNIQSCKDKERELLIILENTQNKLLSVKENYENEINNKPLDKYINEICDNFRLNDKIENYYGYNCLYVIYIDSINETDDKKHYYLKFGETSNVENRMNQHRQKFKNMKIMWIVKSNNANHTEKKLKEWLKTNNMLSKYENQTEIIKFDNEEQLFNIKDKICMLDRENNTINNEILKLNHNIELDNEKINGLQEKIKCLENQIKLYEHIIKITTK